LDHRWVFAGPSGVILFSENAGLGPSAVLRAPLSLRLNNWFSNLNGIMLGRNAGRSPDDLNQSQYDDAVASVLGDLSVPVLMDLDIGHRPPQFTLINGAFATVGFDSGRGSVSQRFD
jgi:muramoyltetrapeptide carboxypeptidase